MNRGGTVGRKRIRVGRLVGRAFLVAYTVFVLFPIIWLLLSSLKTRFEALQLPPTILFRPTTEAYVKIVQGGMLEAFRNSLVIGLANVGLSLLIGVPAGYGLTAIAPMWRNRLGMSVLSTRMAPAFALVVPLYTLMRHLQLVDTVFAVMLTHLTMSLPLAIWLMSAYFQDLPRELEEAAVLDGATRWGVLRSVILPASRPMLAAVAVLVFLTSWNEFLFAFVLSSREARTVPVLLASLAGTMNFDWPLMSAVSVIGTLPALVLVFFAQRHIVSGLTMGAIR